MKRSFLDAKIRIPKMAKGLLVRKRLLRRLEQSDQQSVILHAMMGGGKTSLMSQYAALQEERQAWYHLTSVDNDEIVFIEYLTASIRRVLPNFPEEMEFYRQAMEEKEAGDRIGQHLAAALSEALGDEKLSLMLDDCHVIDNDRIHSILTAFLNYLPSGVRVFLASRGAIPPFAIRKVLEGDALVLGREELSFTQDEIAELLQKIPTMEHQEKTAEIIEEYTSGWPAGVMFLFLYLKTPNRMINRENIEEVCSHFMVHDFIMYEFFRKLPYDIQHFLVNTSILEYLSAGVCNRLARVANSGSILDYLMSEGIFIQKLAEQENIYRYHGLFRSFLLSQLSDTEKSGLFLQAARYFIQDGQLEQAAEYGILAGEKQIVIYAAEMQGETLMEEGKYHLLGRWIEFIRSFPESERYSTEFLLVMAEYDRSQTEKNSAWELLNKARE